MSSFPSLDVDREACENIANACASSALAGIFVGGALTLASAAGGAVATLELPTDGDRPEALPAAPDVQNTSFGRR